MRFIAIASVLVRLRADRAEAHGAGREALHDLARGLDLVERDGLSVGDELHMPRSVISPSVVLVDGRPRTRCSS